MSEGYHNPVMLEEVASFMHQVENPRIFIDATLGEGGHSAHLLKTFPRSFCIGIEADAEILAQAQKRLQPYENRIRFCNRWFDEYFAHDAEKSSTSFVLFDLGISTYHYSAPKRGFSFDGEDGIDMRISQEQGQNAEDLLYYYSESELADIIYTYGEEGRARKIARAIHRELIDAQIRPITGKDLAYVVKGCFAKERRYRFPHPATRVFQALRIAVNKELERLKKSLYNAALALEHRGILLVISFHSLEDRIVKYFFKSHEIQDTNESNCTLQLQTLTKKVLRAKESECKSNPPSRSAKLRAARRVIYE